MAVHKRHRYIWLSANVTDLYGCPQTLQTYMDVHKRSQVCMGCSKKSQVCMGCSKRSQVYMGCSKRSQVCMGRPQWSQCLLDHRSVLKDHVAGQHGLSTEVTDLSSKVTGLYRLLSKVRSHCRLSPPRGQTSPRVVARGPAVVMIYSATQCLWKGITGQTMLLMFSRPLLLFSSAFVCALVTVCQYANGQGQHR